MGTVQDEVREEWTHWVQREALLNAQEKAKASSIDEEKVLMKRDDAIWYFTNKEKKRTFHMRESWAPAIFLEYNVGEASAQILVGEKARKTPLKEIRTKRPTVVRTISNGAVIEAPSKEQVRRTKRAAQGADGTPNYRVAVSPIGTPNRRSRRRVAGGRNDGEGSPIAKKLRFADQLEEVVGALNSPEERATEGSLTITIGSDDGESDCEMDKKYEARTASQIEHARVEHEAEVEFETVLSEEDTETKQEETLTITIESEDEDEQIQQEAKTDSASNERQELDDTPEGDMALDADGDQLDDWDRYPEVPTDDEIKIEPE